MSYKLMGAASLAAVSGATGLAVANREKIFGKSKTLADELKEKGYKLISGVSDTGKRKTILDAKVDAYKKLKDSSQEFTGKNKEAMSADILLKSCQELETLSDYKSVSSKFKKWCVLDFNDVLVTIEGKKAISDGGSDGANWKTPLKAHRAQMKLVITGVTDNDSGDTQWGKVKEWCDSTFKAPYSHDSKDDFDRVKSWCLTSEKQD
ncbi:hypothetical protein MHF_0678 [Mycoplasma haemofelis Ohio2]|uniref:Uncharacterized protein n=1 Tax=Mycoplasma haemofelis (strain Ohio2) TaxID=859194 RepID=F6FIA0_MYCHI|nr:hypothetical protein MHF_0678 [Mycoplasma haemofelis Ohio2]